MTRLLFLALLAAGCEGTETGNPMLDGQVGIEGRTTDELEVGIGSGPALVIEEAWVSLGALDLFDACGDAMMPAAPVAGPSVVELAAGLATPFEFVAPEGTYCALSVPLAPPGEILPPGAPPELEGRTLVVIARRSDGTQLRILSSLAARGDVLAMTGFAYDETQQSFVLTFDVAGWFEGVDVDALPPPGGGMPIVVGDGHHPAVLSAFEANAATVTELFDDEDADGHLDPGEELHRLASHH